MPMSEPTACPSCGATVAGGAAGCQALFEELLARDFSDPRHFAVHRLQVDTYSVQHPERYCQGRHGMVAHLDSVAHAAAVRRWAASAWEAYAGLQPLAREWVRRAREAPAGRAARERR